MSSTLALLLSDARTPSGSYAHSNGLEAALNDAMDVAEIPAFMRARLRTVARCEAAIAARACAATSVEALLALDLEAAARTPAEALRRASSQLGSGLLRTALVWWRRHALMQAYQDRSVLTPRAVAQGVVAGAAGLAPRDAARALLYDDAATLAAAAVKLVALDAAQATGWLVDLADEIDALAEDADRDGLPSTATPLLDRRATAHVTTERRLFAS
jgi:urease accessory protein